MNTPPAPHEVRKFPRAVVQLAVTEKRRAAPPAVTRDISQGGMFIQTSAPLAVGTRFVFNLSLPEYAVPLEITAEVVRVTGEGDRKSTRLNSSHIQKSRMPSSA